MNPRTEKVGRKQRRLDRIASRALSLLQVSDDPEREMAWAEHRLWEENLLAAVKFNRKNLFQWTEHVIAQNQDLKDESLPWQEERDSHPEDAETFEELILRLIPSEGWL